MGAALTTVPDLRRRVRLPLLLCGIALIATGLRLYRLDSWPVFIDEDVFTTAVIELDGLSFPDLEAFTEKTSRPPLPGLLQFAAGDLVGDPLLGGRVLSVVAGTLTTILSYFLGARVGGPSVGLLTALLYALSPLAVLHERMALNDGLLSACSLAAVLLGWRALQGGGWHMTTAAAALAALAVQLKLPAVMLAVTFLVARWIYRRPARPGAGLGAAVIYGAPVASFALVAVPFEAAVVSQTAGRWSPLETLAANTLVLVEAIVTYLPAGLFLLSIAGAVLLARSQPRTAGLLLTAIVCWSAPWVVLSNFAPSRYYLPALPFALALAAFAFKAAWRAPRIGPIACVATVLLVGVSGWNAVRMAVDLQTVDLTSLDDWQYRSGWPAGSAYDDAARYIARTSLEPGSSLAYVIDDEHRVAAGFFDPKPTNVHVLGIFPSPRALVRGDSAPVLVMIDDPRHAPPGQQLEQFEALHPDAQLVMRALRPHAESGVAIVRLP